MKAGQFFRFFILIFFFSVVLILTTLDQSIGEINNIYLLLQQRFDNIYSIHADFTQTIYDENNQIIQQSRGVFSIQKPGYLRWEVTQPVGQLMVVNPKKLIFYDPVLNSVTMRNINLQTLTANIGETPLLIFTTSHENLTQDFMILKINNNSYQLTPKRPNENFSRIILIFDNQNRPQKMILTTPLNQKTILNFSNIQLNSKLSKNLFYFTPPKNSDINYD